MLLGPRKQMKQRVRVGVGDHDTWRGSVEDGRPLSPQYLPAQNPQGLRLPLRKGRVVAPRRPAPTQDSECCKERQAAGRRGQGGADPARAHRGEARACFTRRLAPSEVRKGRGLPSVPGAGTAHAARFLGKRVEGSRSGMTALWGTNVTFHSHGSWQKLPGAGTASAGLPRAPWGSPGPPGAGTHRERLRRARARLGPAAVGTARGPPTPQTVRDSGLPLGERVVTARLLS